MAASSPVGTSTCLECGHERPSRNSCHDRHCPRRRRSGSRGGASGNPGTPLPLRFALPSEPRARLRRRRSIPSSLTTPTEAERRTSPRTRGPDSHRELGTTARAALAHRWGPAGLRKSKSVRAAMNVTQAPAWISPLHGAHWTEHGAALRDVTSACRATIEMTTRN
jgi:hypothetical protein